MKRKTSIIILLFTTIFISSCSSPELSPQNEAYFKFGDGVSEDTFVIKLTDPIKINEARTIISTGSELHIKGIINHYPIDYNILWDYHLTSIDFFENAMEICDSTIAMVNTNSIGFCGEENPCYFCPWNSRLISEVYCNDLDGDSFYDESSLSCSGTDCNDGNQLINPNSIEICGNLVDENCDGITPKCVLTSKKIMSI